jgi:hypothetical protein
MNEQPQEWEWAVDGRMIVYPDKALDIIGIALDEIEAGRIVDAHNAALAAERDNMKAKE